MQPDFERTAAALVTGAQKAIAEAVAPLLKRIEELEARQPEKGRDGITPEPDFEIIGNGLGVLSFDVGDIRHSFEIPLPYSGQARGLFDADADYLARDVVALNGSAFMARHDAPGECPGDGWMLLAQKGKRGDKGASFSGGILDKDTFELCLQRDDGEEVVIDLSALRPDNG